MRRSIEPLAQPSMPSQEVTRRRVGEALWLSNPVRESINAVASEYMDRRWLKSRATRWDYRMTRQALLEELDVRPQDRVLEIGCGPGTWTLEVARRSHEVVAIDISEEMIKQAERYTAGLPVQFVHSDFMASLPQGKFDKIFSVRAVEYIADRDALAEKIAHLLAPRGRVVLITKTRRSVWRGRMRMLYRMGPSARVDQNERPRVRQHLASPHQFARSFAPYGLNLTRTQPLVVRPPIFQKGFHEFPLIPDPIAPPFLAMCTALWRAGAMTPRLLLPLSESYCITFRAVAK